MKSIEVSEIDVKGKRRDLGEISGMLDKIAERDKIDVLNWAEFDYHPEVDFAAAYAGNEIFLKYYVTEDFFKAEKTETNQAVYEDSCVEFFVSPGDDGIYYNLEFNGIGTCLMGFGAARENRTRVDPATVSMIRRRASAGNKPVSERKGNFSWTITIAVPAQVFLRHEIKELRGRSFRTNFYKCGDKLSVPHYLTWNPVKTLKPDFHRPEFFGTMKFV